MGSEVRSDCKPFFREVGITTNERGAMCHTAKPPNAEGEANFPNGQNDGFKFKPIRHGGPTRSGVNVAGSPLVSVSPVPWAGQQRGHPPLLNHRHAIRHGARGQGPSVQEVRIDRNQLRENDTDSGGGGQPLDPKILEATVRCMKNIEENKIRKKILKKR